MQHSRHAHPAALAQRGGNKRNALLVRDVVASDDGIREAKIEQPRARLHLSAHARIGQRGVRVRRELVVVGVRGLCGRSG
jgi:hypothetical protein